MHILASSTPALTNTASPSCRERHADPGMQALLGITPVILGLHRYQTKDLLIREARRRGKPEYHVQPVRAVEDYSPEVHNQRAEYSGVMAELYKLGLKPALLYPAGSSSHCLVEPENGSVPWTRCTSTSRGTAGLWNRQNETVQQLTTVCGPTILQVHCHVSLCGLLI